MPPAIGYARNGEIAVHAAARVMAGAQGGEVFVPDTARDIVVGFGLDFQDRGMHELQGIEGARHPYAVA